MNISDFTYILKNPAYINAAQTDAIAAITKDFPYFQAARIVHLKGLKNQDSFKYNQSLKVAAAHTTDRSILFDFITSEIFEQHETSNTIQEAQSNSNAVDINEIPIEVEEVKVDKNLRMEDAIKTKIQEANAILDPDLFQPKIDPTPITEVIAETKEVEKPVFKEIIIPEKAASPEETLKLGKPLQFEKKEKHSFSEWLQLANFKPIDRSKKIEQEEVEKEPKIVENESNSAAAESEKDKRFDLIDKFIATNPKIKPKPTLEKTVNLANSTTVDQSILMTETLAKVYLEQKKYKKAIKAYNILILKYPEKSGFFADQIRAIKKIQQNN
ncbi:hypothetical protein [uncultured Kordia sp.]|uniref:hypothetical protein n=1 Tax=uncultured Kordia sp. TaxID=507699 RepID=UPI002615E7CF|nr:hypothetical protein [uncultured Kordia sp.]